MRIDLINCILDLLQKNSIVALPGLGSLRLERDSARIARNKIYPPTKNIKFSSKIEQVDAFAVYLREKYGISADNAEKVLKRFSQRLINQLVNYNEVVLPRIGILKTNGNKALKLIKDETAINFSKNYLPILSLERLSTKNEMHSAKTAGDRLDSSENTIKIQEVVAPPKTQVDVQKTEIKTKVETVKATTPIAPQDIQTSTSNVSQGTVVLSPTDMSKSNEANYQFEQNVKEKEGGFSWKILMWILGAMVLTFLLFKTCNKKGAVVVDDVIETEARSTHSDETNDAGNSTNEAGTTFDQNKIYKESELAAIPQEVLAKGCIIIVGSFKKESNAARMMSDLEKKGYQNYQELNANGLHRVGLKFDCIDEDLVDYIQKIRKNIEEKAWYLQPQIHVDY